MTSSIVPEVAWPIIVISFGIVVVRRLWFDDTTGERRLTWALALATTACVLREPLIQDTLAVLAPTYWGVSFTRQLSTTVIVLAMAPLLQAILSWKLEDREPRWLAPLVYLAATAFAPLMLLLGSDARNLGQYIDLARGWETVGYFSMFAVWVGCMAAILIHTCVSELRQGQLAPRHTYSYIAAGAIGLWAAEEAASIMTSAVFASLGKYPDFVEFRFALNANNFVLMVGFAAACAALPAGATVVEHFGLDRTSRDIKILRELWNDLTAVCPEVRFVSVPDVQRRQPRRVLHRMTIEIRDSILILKHFASAESTVDPNLHDLEPGLRVAIQLRAASVAKASGARPAGNPSWTVGPFNVRNDEVRDLKSIAKQWRRAESFTRPRHRKLQPTPARA